jgi:hypothetical protein
MTPGHTKVLKIRRSLLFVGGLCALLLAAGCDDDSGSSDAAADLAVPDGGAELDLAVPAGDLSTIPANVPNLALPGLDADGGVAEAETALALDGTGVVVAGYMTYSGVVRIATARSTDDGESFVSTGEVPTAADEQAADPSLAFDSAGVAHVAYFTASPAGRQIFEAAFDPAAAGGGAWLPRHQVSDATMRFRQAPSLATGGGGSLYVAYVERDPDVDGGGAGDVVLARSIGGATWMSMRLTVSPAPVVPTLARDERGTLHLVFTDEARDVWYTRSSDGGLTLDAPTRLGQAVSPTQAGLTAIDGNVFVTYYDARPAIVLQRSIAGGPFQSTTLTSGTLDTGSLHPQVAPAGPGRIAVAFYAAADHVHGRWRVHVSDDDGATFGQGILISDADLHLTATREWPDWLGDYEALLGGPGGALYTAWTDNRSGVSRIFFAKLTP